MDSLVSTDWLAAELGSPNLVVADASYHLAETGRDAEAEYLAGHISGAVFLNLKSFADPAARTENTMPQAEAAAHTLGAIGIGNDARIVIYDDSAVKTAARAWYMLRLFGARRVAILDGGLAKWKAEGRPLASGREVLAPRPFIPSPGHGALRSKAQVLANIDSGAEQVVDARGAGRFTGEDKEARPGIASGHIPGSRNLHYAKLYNADGTLKGDEEIAALFESAGVDPARPIVTSCGSGVTACTLAFALHRIGRDKAAVYDGSWSEWGADPVLPKASGPA